LYHVGKQKWALWRNVTENNFVTNFVILLRMGRKPAEKKGDDEEIENSGNDHIADANLHIQNEHP
jgi:hypothetical protein